MASLSLEEITIDEVINGSSWLDEVGKGYENETVMFSNLLKAIRCPPEYIELFDLLIQRFTSTLKSKFRNQRVKASGFGSYVSGLCLKNCDLDLFIGLNPPAHDIESTLKYIRKSMFQYMGSEFNRILIIRAKVPIIKCRHVVGFECDISLNNEGALYNSQLLKFYANVDFKLYCYFMCLKLWWKRQALTQSCTISSYGIVLLGIFYLQKQKYVPTVAQLQSHKNDPRVIKGWDTSFSEDISLFKAGVEIPSIIKLLQGFFVFYSKFNFGHYIISPFIGEEILKPFDNPSDTFKFYKQQQVKLDQKNYVCLQDPFEHSFNVTRNTTRQSLLNLQSWCETASAICSKTASKTLLKEIFTSYEKGTRKRVHESNEFDVALICGKTLLPGNDEHEQRQTWVDCVYEAIENILTRVFLADMTRNDNVLTCEFHHGVFLPKKRSQVNREKIPKEVVGLEREEIITKRIMDLADFEKKLTTPLKVTIKCQCVTKPSKIILQFQMENCTNMSDFTVQAAFRKHVEKAFPPWIDDFVDTKLSVKV